MNARRTGWIGFGLLVGLAVGYYLFIPPVQVQRAIDRELDRIAQASEPLDTTPDWSKTFPNSQHSTAYTRFDGNTNGYEATDALIAYAATIPEYDWVGMEMKWPWYVTTADQELSEQGTITTATIQLFAVSNANDLAHLDPLFTPKDAIHVSTNYIVTQSSADNISHIMNRASRHLRAASQVAAINKQPDEAMDSLIKHEMLIDNLERTGDDSIASSLFHHGYFPDLSYLIGPHRVSSDKLRQILAVQRKPSMEELEYRYYTDRQYYYDYIRGRLRNATGLYLIVPGVLVSKPIFEGMEGQLKAPFGGRIWNYNLMCMLEYYRDAIQIARTTPPSQLKNAYAQLLPAHGARGGDDFTISHYADRIRKDGADYYGIYIISRFTEYYRTRLVLELELHFNEAGSYPAELADAELDAEALEYLTIGQGLEYELLEQGYRLHAEKKTRLLFEVDRALN